MTDKKNNAVVRQMIVESNDMQLLQGHLKDKFETFIKKEAVTIVNFAKKGETGGAQIIKICEKFLEEDNQMSTIEIEAVTSLISILSETQGFKDDWLIAMENISLSMVISMIYM